MRLAKKFPRCVTIAVLLILFIQVWANSGLPFSSDLPRFHSAEAASSTITGTISAVESGTTGTSNWSIGSSNENPNGTTVKVDIHIDGATPLTIWGWSININWTASILQLKGVTQGNFLSDGGSTLMVGNSPSLWDNTGGSILGGLACADSSSMTPQTSDTSGVLATLTFLVIDYGTAKITLTNDQLLSTSSERTGTSVPIQNAVMTVNKPTLATSSSRGANIDVFTDHGGIGEGVASAPYAPLSLVQMYALVTYNNASVSDVAVSFYVQNANGSVIATRVAQTNLTGIASAEYRLPSSNPTTAATSFGTWSITGSVDVTQTTVSDTTTFTFGFLSDVSNVQVLARVNAGENLPIKITITNLSNSSEWSELDVTLFDLAQIPVASYTTRNTDPAQNQTITAAINVPDWAFPGQATAHVCLLSGSGTALGPESVVNFQVLPITASEVISSFSTPEYAWGGLVALLATFAAFISFRIVKKGRKHTYNAKLYVKR